MENINVITLRFYDKPEGGVKAVAYAGTNSYLFEVESDNRAHAVDLVATRLYARQHADAMNRAIETRD